MKTLFNSILFLLCLSFFWPAYANSENENWTILANEIVTMVSNSEKLYKNKKYTEAKDTIVTAYFKVFEDQQMEAAMRLHIGAKHTFQVERQFGKLRQALVIPDNHANVSMLVKEVNIAVKRDAKFLDSKQVSRQVFNVNQ